MGKVTQRIETIPNTQRTYCACTYIDEDTNIEQYDWEITAKVDGVRIIHDKHTDRVTTRGGEDVPVHIANALRKSPHSEAELFAGTLGTSISVLRETAPFVPSMLYGLTPIDPRLKMGKSKLNQQQLKSLLDAVLARGIEGLVLRCGTMWMKAVPKRYADVRITGIKEGKGRNAGRVGSIETTRGNVSGMSDEMRDLLWEKRHLVCGLIIEVEYRELHPSGKFRFGNFIRLRLDKTEESI